ncbi:C39 family peptidase [Actinoplanes sp. LDG1-06]|uniref:C39 family peptidase n=1 Tax=Paractinoplanes ovalisporus TaxID=2810368 RepID=A0ABS2AGA2_9ACTN|nr:C39 family peptidase [Actinoplanes ovalisporus]MBM2618815.1 C39 family peptidase [Actinoplanes ovalisporus]
MKRRTLLTAPLIGAAAGVTGAIATAAPASAATYKVSAVWQGQQNGSWCGPAALRMAISVRTSSLPTQSAIASRIGTTLSAGTNRFQMLNGINHWLGSHQLANVESQGGLKASVALREQYWRRLENNIANGFGVLTNVVVPRNSPYKPPGWTNDDPDPVDHWFMVYRVETTQRIVYIIDPASERPKFNANRTYGMRFDHLCQLVNKAYLFRY